MNIYLITSDSFNLINQEIDKIIDSSSNVIKYDLRVETLNDVINEANYFSLTNEKKYIIVKSNELFSTSKKNDDENNSSNKSSEILENYLAKTNPNSILIFTSLCSPDKRKKIFKKISEVGKCIVIPSLNKRDFVYKCMNILQDKKYKIDYETANYICECSYYNYDILLNELDKIYKLIKPCTLNKQILIDVISQNLDGNIYNYINAVLENNIEKAFASTKDFNRLKIDPIMVFIMLAKEFQMLLYIKTHSDLKEIQNKFKKEDWQMKNYILNANNFTEKELKKIITILSDYDYKIKSGKLDKDFLLDLVAMDICY